MGKTRATEKGTSKMEQKPSWFVYFHGYFAENSPSYVTS